MALGCPVLSGTGGPFAVVTALCAVGMLPHPLADVQSHPQALCLGPGRVPLATPHKNHPPPDLKKEGFFFRWAQYQWA